MIEPTYTTADGKPRQIFTEYLAIGEAFGPDSIEAADFRAQFQNDDAFQRRALVAGELFIEGPDGKLAREQPECIYLTILEVKGVGSPQALAFRSRHEDDENFMRYARVFEENRSEGSNS